MPVAKLSGLHGINTLYTFYIHPAYYNLVVIIIINSNFRYLKNLQTNTLRNNLGDTLTVSVNVIL